MCIHGIEEKCVQKSERARVKYSYEPQKRKEDARRFAKKETLARPSPTFFPLPQIFLFFFLLEGETKAKAQEETNQKIPSSKGVCMSILLCVISSSLL